jgi:glutamyl/glutaminyl-tRNA synthetase
MTNTVFNPSLNGGLHIGHLYMILVNEHEAHDTDGTFTVRFDDDQFWWRDVMGCDAMGIASDIMKDLAYFGVKVDRYTSQITSRVEVDKMLYYLNKGPLPVQEMKTNTVQIPNTKNPTLHDPYPYVPWITARKVVEDFMGGITLKIRGDDLLPEYSLYSYFCDLWGLPQPEQWFIPRLFQSNGQSLSDVSKTMGGWKLSNYREAGVDPSFVLGMLAGACLIDPNQEWELNNLKDSPTIDSAV